MLMYTWLLPTHTSLPLDPIVELDQFQTECVRTLPALQPRCPYVGMLQSRVFIRHVWTTRTHTHLYDMLHTPTHVTHTLHALTHTHTHTSNTSHITPHITLTHITHTHHTHITPTTHHTHTSHTHHTHHTSHTTHYTTHYATHTSQISLTHTPHMHLTYTHAQTNTHTHTHTHTHKSSSSVLRKSRMQWTSLCSVRQRGQNKPLWTSLSPGVEHHTALARQTVHSYLQLWTPGWWNPLSWIPMDWPFHPLHTWV